MYLLKAYYLGQSHPTESRVALTAPSALELIPEMLAAHPECDRIEVMCGAAYLFAVDRYGTRLAD